MEFIVVFLLTVTAVFATSSPPQVTIPLGTIEGVISQSVNGREFYSFKGIPYAKPPVGKYKFKESVPPKPWIGTWKANVTYMCIQYNQFNLQGSISKVEGNEDCLYVNVFTPNLDAGANLDVLVYIHGGAFMFNHGNMQGPEMLMDKNIVMATFNYRLGPLGFLSTEDDVVPGNNGLKDQILALKWIKKYIKYFGGNPNSITISGMSAGGASVHWHYLMPKSRGLFHKGISQSGVVFNPWVLMEKPLEKTKKLASLVGCPTTTSVQIVECLRRRPARMITETIVHFQPWLYNPFSPFGVVVDTWSKDPLIPNHPIALITAKQVVDVPWISSHTSAEGLYPGAEFYKDDNLKTIETRWNEVIPHILDYNHTIDVNRRDSVSQKIKEYYFKGKVPNRASFSTLIDMLSDRLFLVDIEKGIRLHAAAVTSDVYSYAFNYRGANSASDFRSGTKENFGVSHTDDTSYTFRTKLNTLSTQEDTKMTNLFLDMFITFMKTGKPNFSNTEWQPVSKKLSEPWVQLQINSPSDVKLELKNNIGNNEFWKSLMFKENENLFPVKDEL